MLAIIFTVTDDSWTLCSVGSWFLFFVAQSEVHNNPMKSPLEACWMHAHGLGKWKEPRSGSNECQRQLCNLA